MRLTSTFFRSYAAAPEGPLDPPAGEAGAERDMLMADLVGGGPDVNPDLTGAAKHRVYDEMAKTDATVKALLWVPTLSIRAANWGLEPKDEAEGLDRLICDMVAWNLGLNDELGEMAQSWPKATAQLLEMMRWGAMLEELVWDFTPGRPLRTWRDADGDEHSVIPLARLAPRRPDTIAKLERNQDGSIKQVTQNLVGTKPIRGDKVTYSVFEDSESGAWDGVSLLRPAWLPWRLKKSLMISAGIGWDRFALGVPVIYHPDNQQDADIATEIGQSLRSHERAYVRFPVTGEGDAGKPASMWALEIMNAATTLADPTPLIRLCSQAETEAGLQLFMRQGMDGTGARAAAETQANPFYLACEAIADEVKRERMRQVVRRIVEINFGTEAAEQRCPVLTVSRIIPRDLDVIARALSYLSTAGFTFTDRGAVDDIRELLGFKVLPNDLKQHGIPRAQLVEILKSAGLDSETFAAIVNQLPPDIGVARNALPEGSGLQV